MNETEQNTTNENFSDICRICLQVHENMINIFESRIDIQLMEVTNLKVMSDDKLPKVLCQNCQSKLYEYFNFLNLAKSSDSYLRSKITSTHEVALKNEISEEKEAKKSKETVEEKLETNSEEYMYFIVVPKEENDSNVYVEKLNCESSNGKVIDFCKNYIKTHISGDNLLNKAVCDAELLKKETKVVEVDLNIYKCTLCGKGFSHTEDLISNCTHNLNLSITCSKYKCPVCCCTEIEKAVFLRHLKNHEKEGFIFVKTNSNEERVLVSGGEMNTESDCKVFLLNLKNFICEMCGNSFESKDLISEHLKSCSFNNTDNSDFLVVYSCPLCHCEFKNDENGYMSHLKSHKSSNIHFINVNNDGVPVEIAQDDLFLPYEEAVEVCKAFGKKVFKILNGNSCDECDFISESFDKLSEHYKNSHKLKKDVSKEFVCPVCLVEFVGDEGEKTQIDFYKHLRVHRSEGFGFVLLNKNNDLVECKGEFSDIFTNSNIVLSVLDHSSQSLEALSPETLFKDGERRFSCDICNESFNKKKEIIKHIKIHFNEKSKYICEKCGKKCKGKLNYKKHFMNHFSTERKKTCMICNKTFAKRATLNGHLRQHIKEGTCKEDNSRIICEKCGKNFSSNAGLTKHKKLHLKDKEDDLKCEICGRSFVSEASFERHKSAHFNPKYFECEVCKLPLPSLTILQKHSLVHKTGSGTFDCKMCKISFLTKDSLTAHQTHTGHYVDRTPLECNVCHEKFFVGRKFTEHIKTHPKYKVGECTLCGKRLATIQSLMLHMNRHFESHSILCPHCGKTFFEEGNYHRHLLTHKGIKPFSCDVETCKKSFYTFSELNRHKRYHNNTRDFRCTYCSKSFHEANHLTVHIRTHTGERPYICPHCNKGFITRTRCKQHIKLVHQGIGYDLIRSSISKKVTVFEAIEAPA